MKTNLSLLMITKNAERHLLRSLSSSSGLAQEIVIVDDFSTDKTEYIAKQFNPKFYKRHQKSFGDQRVFALSKCTGDWILMLDADEIISPELRKEIKDVIARPRSGRGNLVGYNIPFQNHFLGKPIFFGGESYTKLILFQKDKARIVSDQIHERAEVEGPVGTLKEHILHYSYQSLCQMFSKFTYYAKNEAVRKLKNGEKSTIRKIITYPLHMFWARYIKDKGYKDYFLRILLDLGFAYMEFLTYFLMFFKQNNTKKNKNINPVNETK